MCPDIKSDDRTSNARCSGLAVCEVRWQDRVRQEPGISETLQRPGFQKCGHECLTLLGAWGQTAALTVALGVRHSPGMTGKRTARWNFGGFRVESVRIGLQTAQCLRGEMDFPNFPQQQETFRQWLVFLQRMGRDDRKSFIRPFFLAGMR